MSPVCDVRLARNGLALKPKKCTISKFFWGLRRGRGGVPRCEGRVLVGALDLHGFSRLTPAERVSRVLFVIVHHMPLLSVLPSSLSLLLFVPHQRVFLTLSVRVFVNCSILGFPALAG